jgi:hypothetical protein
MGGGLYNYLDRRPGAILSYIKVGVTARLAQSPPFIMMGVLCIDMKSRVDYRDESEHNYPPENRFDLAHLERDVSTFRRDKRNLLGILLDMDYRVVSTKGSGIVRGFKHDRANGELTLNIETDGDSYLRESVTLDQIVKFERMSEKSLWG